MKSKIVFTGSFLEFFGVNVALSIITFLTFGLGAIYQVYWNGKYFLTKCEIHSL